MIRYNISKSLSLGGEVLYLSRVRGDTFHEKLKVRVRTILSPKAVSKQSKFRAVTKSQDT
jgi:hypothetical protein